MKFKSLFGALAVVLLCNVAHAQLHISETRALYLRQKDGSTSDPERAQLIPPLTWGQDHEWRLLLNGDTRYRAENRVNFDGNREIPDNDRVAFWRSRLSADLTYRRRIRIFLEYLDAQQLGANMQYNQEDKRDFHQYFLEIADPDNTPWSLRLGKQEIVLGKEKRLVNASNFNNIRRAFYGGRAMYRTKDLDLDLFVASPSTNSIIDDGIVNGTAAARPTHNRYFYGAYGTFKRYQPTQLELYFLGLSDRDNHRTYPNKQVDEEGNFSTTDRYTVGAELYGPLRKNECGELSYVLGGAYQFGYNGQDDINAWMAHGDIGYQWNRKWKPRLDLEGTIASGDNVNGDYDTNSFNPLFGATDLIYGRIPFFRLQNIRSVGLVGSIDPTSKLKLRAAYHYYWLDSQTDAWYDSNGSSRGRDTTGKSGRDVGQMVDVTAFYKYSKYMSWEGGAAYFLPGNFSGNVGKPDQSAYLFLQTTLSF
ncbi:MAG: alginate export family protein [Candidatus Sumerlaeaceae bacterium]|nr:alginate export family protein [Candidatus Sumerlaeaceae bacterium]